MLCAGVAFMSFVVMSHVTDSNALGLFDISIKKDAAINNLFSLLPAAMDPRCPFNGIHFIDYYEGASNPQLNIAEA